MSTFKYGNTNSSTNNKKNHNDKYSKKVFKETITFIEEKWDKWSKEIDNLNEDSESLQRMFIEYNKDNRFLELRAGIITKIHEKKNMLLSLEKLVLDIKSQISNT
jgi:hypothetical protein